MVNMVVSGSCLSDFRDDERRFLFIRHFDRNEAKLSVVEKSHIFTFLQAIVGLMQRLFKSLI